jgi:5-methyltetrahydrofolate--homocysteine methyltransferase
MLFKSLIKSVVAGDEGQVKETVQGLIDAGIKPLDIVQKGLIAGMDVVGAGFKVGDLFVPEVLMAAQAMKAGIGVVKPLLLSGDMPSLGKIVIGTVQGDLHDIGKNLLAMMMESAGFTVINLGVDITAEGFVTAAVEQKADIIAISALLTTTMLGMKDTVDLLKEKGLLGKFKVIVGGAPISQEFCDEIGASGFAPDAPRAVELCKKLLGS